MFAGGFLTLSTAVGAVATDLLNTFLPGSGRFLFPFIFAWGLVYLLFLNTELTTSNMMYLTAGTYLKKINLVGALLVAFLFNQTTAFAHVDPKGFLATVAENKLQRTNQVVFFEGIIANIFVNIAILSYLYFKDETAKVLLALSAIYMFVFMTNEHLAANFASFSLLGFNPVSSQLPHYELLNILRHYGVTFMANWVGGGVLMGLAYAWLNNIKSLYND